MKFIKHQITEITCEYIAFDSAVIGPCEALIVEISSYGNHEVRRGVYFGEHNEDVLVSEEEFLQAYAKAQQAFSEVIRKTKIGALIGVLAFKFGETVKRVVNGNPHEGGVFNNN